MHRRDYDLKADVSSVSPSSERIKLKQNFISIYIYCSNLKTSNNHIISNEINWTCNLLTKRSIQEEPFWNQGTNHSLNYNGISM